MSKIVRTPTRVEGGVTPEEKVLLDEHAQLWIKRIMRTEPIEPDKIIPAIKGLYRVAGLKEPRVVIVPSPLVMAFAYGAASVILERRNATDDATRNATNQATRNATNQATYNATDHAIYDATREATYHATRNATRNATDHATYDATYHATYHATNHATYDATREATYDATDDATREATYDATNQATNHATRNATYDATDHATYDATYHATYHATRNATYHATRSATNQATDHATDDPVNGAARACFKLAGQEGLERAKQWQSVYQGGNMWGSYDSYLTAMRDILGLRLPEHEAYHYWEQAAIHGGFRIMHPDFCLVCDFPLAIRTDHTQKSHGFHEPSHEWRDGWKLYHVHGERLDGPLETLPRDKRADVVRRLHTAA